MSPSLDLEPIETDSGEYKILISYSLRQRSHVRIEITNGDSRSIRRLLDTLKEPGHYQMIWEGNDIKRDWIGRMKHQCRMTIHTPGGQVIMKSRTL